MKRIIFILSFFGYSGYYVGLAILFSLNMSSLSRFYSIPLRLFLAFLMIICIKKNIANIKTKKTYFIIALFIFFWILYFLKVLYSENITSLGELSKPWYEFIFFAATYVILPFITFIVIDFERYKSVILEGMIFSGFLLGLVVLYMYGGALGTGVGRVSNLAYTTGEAILSPLALSYAGSLTFALCIFKLLIEKRNTKIQKIYLYSTIILSFIMFLLGSSRGSVIALLLSAIVFLGYSPLKNKLQLIVLSILATPVIIWAIEASGSGVISRFDGTKKSGGGGRAAIWSDTIDHFLENPIFGGKIEIGGIYPHNFILEIFMATGIIGAFLILPLIFSAFFKISRLSKNAMFVFLIFIQGFSMHFFSGSFYTATLLFFPLGLIFGFEKYENER